MIHFTCADCGQPQSCENTIQLFNGIVYIPRETGAQVWCPLCYLTILNRRQTVVDILDDLVCRTCGGPAGTHNLTDVAVTLGVRTMRLGVGDYYSSLGEGDEVVQLSYQGYRTPPAPRRTSITLEPGERRCGCNVCERLLFA